tara:strand:+ start:375 stop:578 length:204 start_codon:yes stop_codon:yes gene_type:complete
MDIEKYKLKADQLNNLACKACTKSWIEKHDKTSEPIDDINICFQEGLISLKLKNRLIKEVRDIKKEN